MYRSFTTLLGDFDVAVLYDRGWGSIATFTTAALFGNVVMLNLLIAIVRRHGHKPKIHRVEPESGSTLRLL